MPLIFEDTEQVSKKRIPIPRNAKKTFQALKKIYKPYIDANTPGSKILKSLGSDRSYNKKGKDSKTNGKTTQNSVSVNDAKVRLHRMQKMPKNSVEYQLNGGELAANIYRKGIESARGVKKVDAVKPPKPTSNKSLKPSEPNVMTIAKPNGTISVGLSEQRMLSEGHIYDYIEDYGAFSVLDEFLFRTEKTENWYPLIDPNMYQKALSEFSKYGKFVHFPTKYIYQWMGIIMRNTAKLIANTDLAGHGGDFPTEDVQDFIISYLKKDENQVSIDDDILTYQISYDEIKNLCRNLNEEYGRHEDGQLDLFMNQDEVDDYDQKMHAQLAKKKALKQIGRYVSKYNKAVQYSRIYFDSDALCFIREINVMNFLDEIGLYDWMVLPDGSDAWSDFGLEPLMKILLQYNDDKTPEETIVIINKALDIYHCRGDLSSAFIIGGKHSLSQISEEIKRKRKIYISENQIKLLWQKQ